jgi:hypothetical protein
LNGQQDQKELKEVFNIRKYFVKDGPLPNAFDAKTTQAMVEHCQSTCLDLMRAIAKCLEIPFEHGCSEYFVRCNRFDQPSGDIL